MLFYCLLLVLCEKRNRSTMDGWLQSAGEYKGGGGGGGGRESLRGQGSDIIY